MSLPLMISIVIPFFNREKYLEKAINSILNQTYPYWELILVNDDSNDGSLEIANSFNDPRVRVLSHSPNRGNAFTRNEGWRSSNCTWVAFLDSDDWYEPEYLYRVSENIKNNSEVGFFWTGVRFVNEQGQSLKEEFWKPLEVLPSETFFDQLRIGTNAGVCFSKQVLEQFGGFEEKLRASVDREFFLRISQTIAGRGIDFIGINCLLGCHDSIRKSYHHQAEAYDFLCKVFQIQISKKTSRIRWWYHKAMWLNLYAVKFDTAFEYLRKSRFNSKSLFLYLIFLCFPNLKARKIHKNLSK